METRRQLAQNLCFHPYRHAVVSSLSAVIVIAVLSGEKVGGGEGWQVHFSEGSCGVCTTHSSKRDQKSKEASGRRRTDERKNGRTEGNQVKNGRKQESKEERREKREERRTEATCRRMSGGGSAVYAMNGNGRRIMPELEHLHVQWRTHAKNRKGVRAFSFSAQACVAHQGGMRTCQREGQ